MVYYTQRIKNERCVWHMHIDQLRYFLAVANSGSVNSVADRFFMTPQAINASLRKLEQEFDSPLLVRSKKGISLTPQGHLFAEWAKNVVHQYGKIQLVLTAYNNESSKLSGTLSVFTASVFTELFLPSLVNEFTQIFPNTTVKTITVNTHDILSHFTNGFCDVAFVTAGKKFLEQMLEKQDQDKLKIQILMQDRLVLCAQPSHPLMKQTTISSEALGNYIPKSSNQISFFHVLTDHTTLMRYPSAVSDSTSAELHKKLMQENNVVTCMPNLAYQYHFQNDGIASIPLSDTDTIIHAILYRENPVSKDYALIQQFVETLARRFSIHYSK